MLRERRKMKLIVTYAMGFVVAGFFAVFLVLLFALIPASLSFSFDNIRILYQAHNEFYLLNALPVLFGIAGAFSCRKVSESKIRTDQKIFSYKATLNRTLEFVRQIEKRDLSTPFVAFNGEKTLERAMESMRKSLISASEKEFERNEINRISNETSALLQSFNDIDTLSEETISFLVKKLDNVVQGAFYLVEGENEHDKVIRMKASYAYNRKKHLHAEFKFAQGLVGQAAIEKTSILRTEIPDDYLTIKSGLLGDRKPKSIIITPFIMNDTVYGVIELASFRKFTALQCRWI